MGLQTNRIIKIIRNLDHAGDIRGALCLLGVQTIHIIWDDFLEKTRLFDIPLKTEILEAIYNSYPIDTYRFFEMLGFTEVNAIDISDYEGANIVLDLNKECGDELKERFDVIIDGGTLEHVFDVASALKNMCKMLKKGGVIIHGSPLRGYVDHGFYNFSPTLFIDFYRCNNYQIIGQEIEFVMDAGEEKHERWESLYSQDCRLFSGWERKGDVESYLKRVAQISDIGRMVLWSIVKKRVVSDRLIYPMQSMFRDMEGWDDGRTN